MYEFCTLQSIYEGASDETRRAGAQLLEVELEMDALAINLRVVQKNGVCKSVSMQSQMADAFTVEGQDCY